MKTKKEAIINMVKQLYEVNEMRKAADKAEKILKTAIKDLMGNEAVLEAGDFIVLVESRTRTDLDRKALTIELGNEYISKFTKSTSYEVLSVKTITKQEV